MLADAYSNDVVRGLAEGFIFIFKLYTFSFFSFFFAKIQKQGLQLPKFYFNFEMYYNAIWDKIFLE